MLTTSLLADTTVIALSVKIGSNVIKCLDRMLIERSSLNSFDETNLDSSSVIEPKKTHCAKAFSAVFLIIALYVDARLKKLNSSYY